MGFSVSGSAAILFIAAFVSVGILYSAAYNGYERVQDADDEHGERVLEERNTAVNVTSVTYNDSESSLTVNVTNEGSTTLSVDETDFLVDGELYPDNEYKDWNVDGQSDTGLWLSGETLTVKLNVVENPDQPDRVKVATSSGVSATEVV